MKKQVLFSLIVLIVVSMLSAVTAKGAGGEVGRGGCAVPITTISLSEQGTDYNMKPGRLKFEFNERLYAIQVRRVKQEYVEFLVMTLDMNKQEDITAYTLDDSFNLSINDKKEIDLDKNGINDVLIELRGIISTGEYNSVRFADFSIQKMNNEKIDLDVMDEEVINPNQAIDEEIKEPETTLVNDEESIEITNEVSSEIQEIVSEPVIVLDSKEQPTFLEKIISFFRVVFRWK